MPNDSVHEVLSVGLCERLNRCPTCICGMLSTCKSSSCRSFASMWLLWCVCSMHGTTVEDCSADRFTASERGSEARAWVVYLFELNSEARMFCEAEVYGRLYTYCGISLQSKQGP